MNAQILIPLTEEERDFAERNHYLVISFLDRNELEMDEYYDMLIFRYLRAVKKYLSEHDRRSDFASVVDKSLGLALRDTLKKQYRQEQYENLVSIDRQISEGYTLLDVIADNELDVCEEVLSRIAEERMLSRLTEQYRRILCLRADGYTNREIARHVGIPKRRLGSVYSEIRTTLAF